MAETAAQNIFYVYEHWRTDRQECFHVGKGKKRRAYTMACRNKHHQGIVAKLHKTGHAVEVKIVASGLSEDQAYELEIQRISFWREMGVDLTNIADGGRLPPIGKKEKNSFYGKKHTEEAKAKIAAAKLGKQSPYKGKVTSEEVKAKIAAAMKGNKHWVGRKHSAETRAKISQAAKLRYAHSKGAI
jgi:hypothetical protein